MPFNNIAGAATAPLQKYWKEPTALTKGPVGAVCLFENVLQELTAPWK